MLPPTCVDAWTNQSRPNVGSRRIGREPERVAVAVTDAVWGLGRVRIRRPGQVAPYTDIANRRGPGRLRATRRSGFGLAPVEIARPTRIRTRLIRRYDEPAF